MCEQPPDSAREAAGGIDEGRAVALAEAYIAENSFTTAAPNMSRLTFDVRERLFMQEGLDGVEFVLAGRYNTLAPTAYGICRRGRDPGTDGWMVIFVPSDFNRSKTKLGRAVTMELDGSDIRMAHRDFILKRTDKVFRR